MRLYQIITAIFSILVIATMVTAATRGGGTASALTAICDPELFPIEGLDATYAYGCVDASHARSCRISDVDTISENFQIPPNHALLQRCSSATASTTATSSPSESPSSLDCSKCKEIDAIWERIRGFLNLREDKANKLWDKGWKDYNVIYAPPPAAYETAEGGDSFDNLIRFAANQYNVEARAIKAIMLQESSGQPNAISNTNCVGLMQICLSSAPAGIIITKCTQSRNDGPVLCDGKKDDRFDPQKNLLVGASVFQQKWNAVKNCGNDRLKATVAAYNAGEGVIRAAIAANDGNCNDWDLVERKITPELLKYFFTDDWISQTIGANTDANSWRAQKVEEIKTHVEKFTTNYNRLDGFQ